MVEFLDRGCLYKRGLLISWVEEASGEVSAFADSLDGDHGKGEFLVVLAEDALRKVLGEQSPPGDLSQP